MKEKIVEIVNRYPEIKVMSLIPKMAEYLKSGGDLLGTIDKMVDSGELVEVNYILPTMSYREKSILFPKGTKIIRHRKKAEE